MRLILLCILLGSVGSWADGPDSGKAPVSPSSGSGNVIRVFDDGVFDLQSKKSGPETTKGLDGKDRYVGPEADYNSAQRAEWIETCSPEKNVSVKAYQDCFSNERRKSSDFLRKKELEVEGRQSAPLRNSDPRKSAQDVGISGAD